MNNALGIIFMIKIYYPSLRDNLEVDVSMRLNELGKYVKWKVEPFLPFFCLNSVKPYPPLLLSQLKVLKSM